MNTIKEQFKNKNQIAILLDPEKKASVNQFLTYFSQIDHSKIDYLFVGGSTATRIQIEELVSELKIITKSPILLFPGNSDQFSAKADGILFLNLISGRNPKYLIESQIDAAVEIFESGIPAISTSYILIDGKNESSVKTISQTEPIDPENVDLIFKTALAGKLIGHEATYLEAGSGAKQTVPINSVNAISKISNSLIVGGGIRTIQQISDFHQAGVNIVVVGNYIESNPHFLNEIIQYKSLLHEN